MTSEMTQSGTDRGDRRIALDRHGPEYRTGFVDWAERLHAGPRIAWNDTHGGYWSSAGTRSCSTSPAAPTCSPTTTT